MAHVTGMTATSSGIISAGSGSIHGTGRNTSIGKEAVRMRIRSIKPEFWRSDDIAQLAPKDVFSGPMPTNTELTAIAPSEWNIRYVYCIFGPTGLLYVGKAGIVRYRITAHRRKPWFKEADYLEILSVTGGHGFDAELMLAQLEKLCIANLLPLKNLAGPKNLPARRIKEV